MDFFNIKVREIKSGDNKGMREVYPNFVVGRSSDLMVKAKSFYAIWDEEKKLWSTDEYDVQRIVDNALREYVDQHEGEYIVKYMRNFDSDQWTQFRRFVNNVSDNARALDNELIFYDQETKKTDFATKKLSYPLDDSFPEAWDTIMSTLYSETERRKIEWAIGSIYAGASKDIQKFLVFYGPPGTGKSTVMKIIKNLFDGYTATFDARALGQSNAQFSTSMFKDNPLVAIQDDGDLSRSDDNTKLNSIVSHEDMIINEKNKPMYTMRSNAFLFMGTNQPVKISDAKSGLIRRLIDVEPTGNTLPHSDYRRLMNQVGFESGAIAKHCLDIFNDLGEFYYDDYRPIEMMYKTDHFLNFVSDNFDVFNSQDYTTSKQAYTMYKEYCEEYGVDHSLSRQKFQAELTNYFERFLDRYTDEDGRRLRGVYLGFDFEKYKPQSFEPNKERTIALEETESIFDKEYAEQPAQLTKDDGTPQSRWVNVQTKLSDLNTRELHYVKVPLNHIVIDFDLKNADGEKDLNLNLHAASEWPATYAELSKSGKGVHLHYIYDGDPETLDNIYEQDVEIKVYKGDSSLRRKLTRCNGKSIAHISSGLPTKEKQVLSEKTVRSEKGLRDLVERNLRKEIHPGTKPSVDFIKKILDDAYSSGLEYDLTDMRGAITMFASKSSNHGMNCVKLVKEMKFKSEGEMPAEPQPEVADRRIVFYDVEVYPNLFHISWKFEGTDKCVRMTNPTPEAVQELLDMKLVGFYNRRYDNHILYARTMGYSNEDLFDLSTRIIGNEQDAMFGAAYNLSYADVWEFASKKQSLKKWEFELGVKHVEMDIPWNEPVPEDRIADVASYCDNDVFATEAVFNHLAADFKARKILADISGLAINEKTQKHTEKIIFGNEREPQRQFIYTNLATGERTDGVTDSVYFEGYEYDFGKSTYRGEEVGEGGYVYAEPGSYENVALIDVASMHPNSIRNLEAFGPYTSAFTDLVDARVAIKHGDYDTAREALDGALKPYLEDDSDAKELSYALKIIINIVYGMTSAKFPNKFKDPRNKDNIVAKRGALFMIDLKHFVQEQGYSVAHIKTDSIKIPNADDAIIQKVVEFGKLYGYDFEHEATYEKFVLFNDAVYIARDNGKWSATGAQFLHPFVFKTLLSGEEIEGSDYIENKSVQKGHIYLTYDSHDEKTFIGKASQLVAVNPTHVMAATPIRIDEEGREYAVAGTKGYKWAEANMVSDVEYIDLGYYEGLTQKALEAIEKFVPYKELVQ